MLSEISQTEKYKHSMISFIYGIQKIKEKNKVINTENRLVLPAARGGGR